MRLVLFLILTRCAFAGFCINAGGPTTFVNNDGVSVDCFADEFFSGGTAFPVGADVDPHMGPGALATLRYGFNGSSFTYTIPTMPNLVVITLDFVEPNKTAAGQRVFNVSINGTPARAWVRTPGPPAPNGDPTGSFSTGSEDFDIFALAGPKGHYRVKYVYFSLGTIRITFSPKRDAKGLTIGNAIVNRIQIDDGTPQELFPDQARMAAYAAAVRDQIAHIPPSENEPTCRHINAIQQVCAYLLTLLPVTP